MHLYTLYALEIDPQDNELLLKKSLEPIMNDDTKKKMILLLVNDNTSLAESLLQKHAKEENQASLKQYLSHLSGEQVSLNKLNICMQYNELIKKYYKPLHTSLNKLCNQPLPNKQINYLVLPRKFFIFLLKCAVGRIALKPYSVPINL